MAEVGVENIVLETDAPFLAPVPYRGKTNESSYIPHIVDQLAAILDISPKEIIEKTSTNALDIYKI